METLTREIQATIKPYDAVVRLKEGNTRFLQNRETERDLLSQVQQTGSGQFPFAALLSCIDSRVPAELVFDQGIGDIFNVRVAGNIVNEDVLGSLEYSCKVAGSKLVLVLGSVVILLLMIILFKDYGSLILQCDRCSCSAIADLVGCINEV